MLKLMGKKIFTLKICVYINLWLIAYVSSKSLDQCLMCSLVRAFAAYTYKVEPRVGFRANSRHTSMGESLKFPKS